MDNQSPKSCLQSHHLIPRLMKLTVYEISTLHFLHSYNEPATVAPHLCSNVQFNDPIKLITIENIHDARLIMTMMTSSSVYAPVDVNVVWIVHRNMEWMDDMDAVLRR